MDRSGGRRGGTAIDDADVVSGGQQPGNQSLSEIAVSADDTCLAHGVPPPRRFRHPPEASANRIILPAYASRLKEETWEIRPPHRRTTATARRRRRNVGGLRRGGPADPGTAAERRPDQAQRARPACLAEPGGRLRGTRAPGRSPPEPSPATAPMSHHLSSATASRPSSVSTRTADTPCAQDPELISRPEIIEVHHVVGEDCWILKVAVADTLHLEDVLEQTSALGRTTTSIVLLLTGAAKATAALALTSASRNTVGMRIGQLAARAGTTTRTLRYYESRGCCPRDGARTGTGRTTRRHPPAAAADQDAAGLRVRPGGDPALRGVSAAGHPEGDPLRPRSRSTGASWASSTR